MIGFLLRLLFVWRVLLMSWTTPGTRSAGDVLSAASWNEQVRDNLLYLFSGRFLFGVVRNNTSNYTTTSASLVDLDATNLKPTVTTQTGNLLVTFAFACYVAATANANLSVAITVDGVVKGLLKAHVNTTVGVIQSATVPISGLSVGSHTVSLQVAIQASTLTIIADGTNGHVCMSILEV